MLEKSKQDDDTLIDAVIPNVTLLKALLASTTQDDRNWYLALLNDAISEYLIAEMDLATKATDELMAEVGYTVKTAVDDEEFKLHDDRN